MPPVIVGIIASTLLFINILICATVLFILTFFKLVIPIKPVRKGLTILLTACANTWVSGNSGWIWLTQKMDWRIERPSKLDKKGWYFIISNHQSWVDILVLQHALNGRIPLLKFFLKQELIKVPIMGAAWWALDFPFMKRYSKEYLDKHPEKRGQDLETTRKACAKFKDMPTSVMNFLEGTRFTEHKFEKQQSGLKNLLKPKAGGMAFAMSAMGDRFRSVLDVTIYYPQGIPSFWDFMQGKMQRCTVIIKEIAIPQELLNGDYENDAQYRLNFQQWVQTLWEDKDVELSRLKAAS
jgi:1-acyl-sn-glycerol-3-phosphate acyltransferase